MKKTGKSVIPRHSHRPHFISKFAKKKEGEEGEEDNKVHGEREKESEGEKV
jgi:hypothetical protein